MRPLNEDFDQLPDVCAYCGVSPAPTRDHVIPEGFRPRTDPIHDWIYVKCCEKCNNDKSRLDGEVRNHLALYQDARGNISADSLVENAIPNSMKKLQERGRMSPTLAMLKSMKPKICADGTIVEMMGQQDKDIFQPWLEYVIKGLAYALWQVKLEDIVFELKAFTGPNFFEFLSSQPSTEFLVSLGNHTKFSYEPMTLGGGYGLWIFQFFGGLGFAVLTMPTDLARLLDAELEETS